MFKRIVSLVLMLSMVMVACSNQTTSEKTVIDNPTPEEILTENENADIFVLNDIVYSNAEDIEWVNKKELALGDDIGEIKKQTESSADFENHTATKLEVGTTIYETVEKSDIYIVKVNNKEIRYLGLREG
ncbi:hypothetical protein [Alkalibacillus almallahensis]|uniref:hypothetical protein n=1 Tax=Alkalibacillus almallahensis TaxID=1379154 RepID=UPI0014226CF3|nr:hypothetical protein [Alkalibacillus almallahensis]NIK11727.1 hypothetical protein [Alkalibacillus almallahensis]